MAAVALALRRDGGHPIAAGIFGFSTVVLFGAFVGALWSWFGWLDGTSGSAFGGFDVGRLTFVLLVLVGALVGLQLFRFPLIVLVIVGLSWFFVTDLLSGGGSWSAIVTFLVGLVFLAAAVSRRRRAEPPVRDVAARRRRADDRRQPRLLPPPRQLRVGARSRSGACCTSLLADALGRSSWAVLGTLGILMASVHYTVELTHIRLSILGPGIDGSSRGWAPAVVFAIAGSLLVLLGGMLARRARAAA